jgi:hypothetical protein
VFPAGWYTYFQYKPNPFFAIFMKHTFTRLLGKVSLLTVIVTGAPILLTYAQTTKGSGKLGNITDVTDKFTNLGNTFIQVLIAFAVIWIIFNVVRYLIVGADSEDKRKTARQAIIWGIIGLAIIISIWGLVNLVLRTFVFENTAVPTNQFPKVPTRSGNNLNPSVNSNASIPRFDSEEGLRY